MKFPAVNLETKDRDEKTDTLIKSLLNEEKSSKKQKRDPRGDVGAPPAQKGKTLAEIEAEEGGPVKESLVGMAQTKRAQDRKKRDVDVGDTDIVANTERFEKAGLEVEQEEGITFEPFNLKQEREEGYFDEDGNYVFRKKGGEEGEEEEDAWLASDEAKVVSEAVRQRIREQQARADEAARRGPLTERQIAQRKADMAAVMRPGETVTRALKRLGAAGPASGPGGASLPHRAMGKRERARLLAQQQQQQQQSAGQGGADGAATADAGDAAVTAAETQRTQFTRLTELADELLEEGELEIYESTVEELQRSARVWLPQLPAAPAPPVQSAVAGAAGGAGAAADDDDDMFADDDDGGDGGVKKAQAPTSTAAAADEDMFADEDGKAEQGDGGGERTAGMGPSSAAQPAAAAAAPDLAAGAERAAAVVAPGPGPGPRPAPTGRAGGDDGVDYASWPIKELKRLLQERGVDPSGFVEKSDLVARVKEVVAAGPAGGPGAGGAGAGDEGAFVAPPGYVFEPSSGYFYSDESGMYYDTSSGGYCQAATSKWFYLDPSSGSFVEWKQ